MTVDECRPEVKRFAILMEQILRDNDYKGGWENMRLTELSERLLEEVDELEDLLARRLLDGNPVTDAELAKEIADIGNFCMMLADNMGVLPE